MIDPLMLVVLGVLPGAAIGAGLALAIARWRGMFNPVVKVTVQVRAASDVAGMPAAQEGDYTVVVRPVMIVSWDVLYNAAAGAGHVVVPKEFAPPQH